MKTMLVAALAAISFLSCSKGNDQDSSNSATTNVALALNVSTRTVQDRAIEDPTTIGTLDIKTLIIELYDVNKKIIGTAISLTADQIAAATDPTPALGDASRIVIEDVPGTAVYVKLYAYQAASKTSPDLTLGVNTFQDGFLNVPFNAYSATSGSTIDAATGLITINKSTSPAPGPGADGKKIWTVEANMSAYFARFEVKGTLTASDVVPIAGGTAKPWASIVVTGIYMNNVKDKMADAALTLIKGNNANWDAGDWATGHPYVKTTGNWSNMFDVNAGQEAHGITNSDLFAAPNAGKVAAYQVFPQGDQANATTIVKNAVPHVVVRMLITPDKDVIDRDPYYAFITLAKFKVDATNYLNKVERGKLYRVDLGTLAKLTPGDPDPDPESADADLYVKLTIDNWTEVTLSPEL